MAEAYLNSKSLPRIRSSSSGTQASENKNGPLSWVTDRLIKENSLVPFVSPSWTQTTLKILNEADRVVFIQQDIYDFCNNVLGYTGTNYEVWNISDISFEVKKETKMLESARKTFILIQKNVDTLIAKKSIYLA